MKKYIGLFIVLLLAFVVNIKSTRAEDTQDAASAIRDADRAALQLKLGGGQNEKQAELKKQREVIRAEMEQKLEEAKIKIEALRQEAKTKFQALKESIKNEKDAAKAKMAELRITGREQALIRFDNAVSRMNSLSDKLSALITKLSAKGINTTEAESYLGTAKAKIADVSNKIAQMNALLAKSAGELTAENKTTLRTLAQDTQTLIKEAHSALISGVKSLKDQVKATLETKKQTEVEKDAEGADKTKTKNDNTNTSGQ